MWFRLLHENEYEMCFMVLLVHLFRFESTSRYK